MPNFSEHSAAFARGVPDNSALLRRLAVNVDHEGEQKGALGDYPSELHHRVVGTKGGAGQQGGRGPMSSPVIEGPKPEDSNSLLKQIRDLLQRMPGALSLEARTAFSIAPREAISFISPSIFVNVGPAAAVAVATQTVQERFTGYLTAVGIGTAPVGALPNITWQIRIDGAIHPEFSNRLFAVNNLATPIPFQFELTQARTVQLVAINGGGAIVTCAGVLVGWTEYMSTYKPYGSSPATGIA